MATLQIGDFAKGRAKLDAGLARDSVFGELGVDAPTWASEEESLLLRMAHEVERGELGLLEEYRRVYRSTWSELTGLADVESATPAAAGAIERPSSADPSPPVLDGSESPAVQRASFQLTKLPMAVQTSATPLVSAPPASTPAAALKETAHVDLSKIIAALPFPAKQAPRGSLSAALDSLDAALKAPIAPTSSKATGTDDLDMRAVRREVTPFVAAQSATPVPESPGLGVQQAGRPRTVMIREEPATSSARRPTLPFQEERAPVARAPVKGGIPESTMPTDSAAFQEALRPHLKYPVVAVSLAAAPPSNRARPEMTLPPTKEIGPAPLPFGRPGALEPRGQGLQRIPIRRHRRQRAGQPDCWQGLELERRQQPLRVSEG